MILYILFIDVPDSKTFDVTLIIMLLRNLTDQTPPHSGYDKLPSANETTPTSDLARIKYYRNFLSHLDDGKIDNTTFATAWNTVTDVSTSKKISYHGFRNDNLYFQILNDGNQINGRFLVNT